MKTLNDIQQEIGEWSTKTFGPPRAQSKILHMQREVEELLLKPGDIFEMADILILLLDIARTAGHSANDLVITVQEKMEINKKRNWGNPDKNGVVEHVEDGD